MQLLDGLTLGGLAAAVVARRRRHVGVPGELLHGADIDLGFEQVADEAGVRLSLEPYRTLRPIAHSPRASAVRTARAASCRSASRSSGGRRITMGVSAYPPKKVH